VVAAYADSDLAAGRRELRGVLDEIREHLLDLDVVELDRRKIVLDLKAHGVFRRDRPETTRDVLDERTDVVPGLVRNKAPVLDAREVEEIADDAVEAERLFLDRHRELFAVPIGPNDVTLPQAPGGREDRRERRAQLVRNGVQQLGLELVRPPQDLGVERLFAEARAFDRHTKLRRRDREEPFVGRAELGRAAWARARSRAASVPVTIAVSRKSARENSSSGFATTS